MSRGGQLRKACKNRLRSLVKRDALTGMVVSGTAPVRGNLFKTKKKHVSTEALFYRISQGGIPKSWSLVTLLEPKKKEKEKGGGRKSLRDGKGVLVLKKELSSSTIFLVILFGETYRCSKRHSENG